MVVELWTSAFCAPCRSARRVVQRAADLVPALRAVEVDVAADVERAAAEGISGTPTVVLRDADGREVFRAAGVPTLPQLLAAVAGALPRSAVT
ncbi:thioredoxin family protein [Kineococcus sp. NPDC059986]|uniref:thioredoxin family protein n=1 Tax=Kineococcus sp. NPDC059986 TaxID=3155538 RepID=UPI00344B33AE